MFVSKYKARIEHYIFKNIIEYYLKKKLVWKVILVIKNCIKWTKSFVQINSI